MIYMEATKRPSAGQSRKLKKVNKMEYFNNANFNADDFQSCVNRGISLLKNREEQAGLDGHEWPCNTESCRWAIEQAIINRASKSTMMSAVIEYVEKIEYQFEQVNGL